MSADGCGQPAFLPVQASSLGDVTPHGFFAPVSRDTVEELIKACARDREKIESIAGMAKGFFGNCLEHFRVGNFSDVDRRPTRTSVEEMFAAEGALKHLYASYWQRALALTDVYDHMPQARRDEWNNSIRAMETPEFSGENVIPTLRDLLISRERFLGERVDGIFRNLSGEHVTNSPAGFRQRMIIAHLVTAYGSTNDDRVGYINDLRCVIARLMGRDQPKWYSSSKIVEMARTERRGEWVTIDGGALRLRAYKCGTAHIEVDEDLAWRLNAILATLHPSAIPSEFLEKPKKKAKTFRLIGRPLPFSVLDVLAEMRPAQRFWKEGYRDRSAPIPNTLRLPYGDLEKTIVAEVEKVCEALGGVKVIAGSSYEYFEFDYSPYRVIGEVLASGCLPDQKSHQFYPTPESLARRAVEAAQIGPHDTVLEPSAGQGHIAGLLPPDRTTCVEISGLHCKILRAKGLKTAERDFIEWAAEQHAAGTRYDRIVANPPFSDGRARMHLEAASGLLMPGGRLVAILPASFSGKPAPAGWVYEWSKPIENEFADTSISVVMLTALRLGG